MTDTYLSKTLEKQLDTFIDNLEKYNNKRSFPQAKENYKFLRDFYKRFLTDRNKRSKEVSSAKYAKVIKLANDQFSALTLWNLCMDGRVLAVLINGASAKVGSSIRVPGGNLREFVRARNGKYKLLEESVFAKLLKKAVNKSPTHTVYEVFDSHIGCAARKAEEMSHGIPALGDSGLLSDVIHSRRMARATCEFVEKNLGPDDKVIPIQTSFDPHSGFMYMGLETEEAFTYARAHGNVYSNKILEDLRAKRMIIFSHDISENPSIKQLFKKYAFTLDWKNDYVKSAMSFWKNISFMKEKGRKVLREDLIKIYPYLAENTQQAKDELNERVILLLTNAYSGYLNNKEYLLEHGEYPYGVHREEGVKVSEGGHPPYEISMFVVFGPDKKNLPVNIELAASLVRNNRREKRVTDRSGIFEDPDEFAAAVVPLLVQETIREDVTQEEWEKLSTTDWSDLPLNWDKMTDGEFYHYLQGKVNMSIAVANGLNQLREKMAILYDPDQPTSSHLVEHYKVALPVVNGSDKKNHFIMPFVKLGFE